jgi:hypothetical protein
VSLYIPKFTLFGNLSYNPKLRAEDERKLVTSGIDMLVPRAHSVVTAVQSTPRLARQSPFHQFSFGKKSASLARTADTRTRSVGTDTSSFVVYERPETEFSSYLHSQGSTIIEESDRSRTTIASPVQYRSAVTPQSTAFSVTQSPLAICASDQRYHVGETPPAAVRT